MDPVWDPLCLPGPSLSAWTVFLCFSKKENNNRGQNREKLRKNKEKLVFISFSYVFLIFYKVFLRFSLDFCKGRISQNTLQIALNTSKNPSLTNCLCFDPWNLWLKSIKNNIKHLYAQKLIVVFCCWKIQTLVFDLPWSI